MAARTDRRIPFAATALAATVFTVICALLATTPARGATPAQRAYDAGVKAYVHGFPPVISRLSQTTFPPNTMLGIADTPSPASKLVVLPNVDTSYTVGKLDLSAGPLVVHVPARRRYYELQLMDAYTNVFGYIGTRTTGHGAGDYALTAPGWHGSLPAGVKRIASPTPDVLMLGRTLIQPSDSHAHLKHLLAAYSLTPLATVAGGGPRKHSLVLDTFPNRPKPVLPRGLAFLDAFDQLLADDPPARAEQRALRPLRQYGIGAGLSASTATLPAKVRHALARGVDHGQDRVDAAVAKRRKDTVGGWSALDPHTGASGTDYLLRAITATIGLWANTPAEASYVIAANDAAGRPLSGRHRYALRFTSPPPVKAFWSLTMYDRDLLLHANPQHRYAIGDRTAKLRRRHGALTLRLQHARPHRDPGNWLPSPRGRFTVALRLYVPKRAALRGHWRPPGIVCLDCRRGG